LTLYYRTNYKASEKLRELFSFQESREPPLLQLSVREGLFLCYSETQARMTKIESQTLFKKKNISQFGYLRKIHYLCSAINELRFF